MEFGGLFDSEFEFEFNEIEGVQLKMKQQDAGQIDNVLPLTVWPAAIEACRQVELIDLEGKKVLELGGGPGLCGIYIAKNKNCEVLITDGSEASVELIKENLELNGVAGDAQVFWWGESAGMFDFIIGSDVVYSQESLRPLVQSIVLSLKDDGTALLCNCISRFFRFRDQLAQLLKENQMEVELKQSIFNRDVETIAIKKISVSK